MYPWTCVRLFGVRRRVSGYPLSRDPLTKQKIMSKSPLFRLTSVLALDLSPLGITQSHNIIVFSRKTVSPPHSPPALLNHVLGSAHLHESPHHGPVLGRIIQTIHAFYW